MGEKELKRFHETGNLQLLHYQVEVCGNQNEDSTVNK